MATEPTVGRIVHYYDPDDDDLTPSAAMIVNVVNLAPSGTREVDIDNFQVDLVIFSVNGQNWCQDVPFSEVPCKSAWSWPSRL